MLREFKLALAQRTARAARLRYKLAGAGVALGGYAVVGPVLSLLIDPYSESLWAFAGITLLSAILLLWGYYVATGMLARRRVLER